MTVEQSGDSSVRQLRSRRDTDRLRADVAELSAAITVVSDWPQRRAVVIGDALQPAVVEALAREGLSTIPASVRSADAVVATAAPAAFIMMGSDAFQDDDCLEHVRRWHQCTPAARLKLVWPPSARTPEVLVRAMQAGVTDVLDPGDPASVSASVQAALRTGARHRERVLAIGAHPDDVELGCAGTLLDHRRRGDRISILTLSRGAVGGNATDRLQESIDTAHVIGAQLLFGDLPDTCIDSGIDTIQLIESVVSAIDPSVVYVHSGHDSHQDHRAVHIAARSATRAVRRVFAYQSPSATNEFFPSLFENVDATIHAKAELLQLFRSQDGRTYLEPELVIAGARYWARHLGASARYAEPFEVVRSVGELRHAAMAPSESMTTAASDPVNEVRSISADRWALAAQSR